jgi:Xaa-Pro aminopeptidase
MRSAHVTPSPLSRLRRELARLALDGVLISSGANVSYLTGIISRDSYLLVTAHKTFYLTDSRYLAEAQLSLPKGVFTIVPLNGPVSLLIADMARTHRLSRLGAEEKHLSYWSFSRIKEVLEKGGTCRLAPFGDFVDTLRQVKTPAEIATLSQGLAVTMAAYTHIARFLEPGLTELEVSAEIERFIRTQGASGASFDIIVAAGKNGSYPHYLTGTRKIAENDSVLVDMGVSYLGYKTDLTRVFFLGKINVLTRRIYTIVRQAQEKAFKAIRPGVKASAVDAAARRHIADKGFGRYFEHSTGHGVGLEVHEGPSISGKSPQILQKGMVFTVEPGIYLPGRTGVRIEDMVLVTGKGVEVLSGALDK